MAEVMYSENRPPLTLEETEFLFAKNRDKIEAAQAKAKKVSEWGPELAELAMLRNRIRTQNTALDLGNGDTITIRTHFSEAEEQDLQRLLIAIGKGDHLAPYKVIEMVTANELITSDWLLDHPNDFATQDALDVIVGYLETRDKEREDLVARINRLASFRQKPGGPGVGGSVEIPGDSRSS